jgi:SPP1 family phage portal protein
MLQITNLEELHAEDIPKLLDLVEPILKKRKSLHEKYTRKASSSQLMYSGKIDDTIVPFEKYITDLATGYLSGKPIYSVTDTLDEDKIRLLESLLDKPQKDEDYKKGMEIIIDYITGYNDDATEHYNLVHDILELTSCYELIYENENNEIVYSKYDPLQTVATWDYEIPANLTGLIRVWDEKTIDNIEVTMIELTDKNGTRVYEKNKNEVVEREVRNHNWGDVPAFAIETDYSVFESCEDVIAAYEQLIQNIRNTYQYNDVDCKMKITGYTPENPMIIPGEDGGPIINEARLAEDNAWLKSKTIYVGEGGDVSWLIKEMDSNGATDILKTYVDLMFQLAGIPNTSDLAFNSTDLNASAIDRKFYVMNMATSNVVSELKKAYLRRWELIFNRINLKKGTQFDFRDIDIDLPKNLPANDDERIDSMMKLQSILSEQTIIEKLGYNYLDEKNKKDAEAEDNMLANIERIKSFEVDNTPKGEINIENEEIEEDTEKE